MTLQELEKRAKEHQLSRTHLREMFGDLRFKKTRVKIANYLADEHTQLMHSYWKEVAKRLRAKELDYFDLLATD